MRVIVTCGPSYEPIDCVRRLTNFSTGELGLMLAGELARAGHTVLCMKGIGATSSLTPGRVEVQTFSTNDDLSWKLNAFAGKADVIFHTAALCDYRVRAVENTSGEDVDTSGKVPTRMGELVLRLAPTTKVLPQLRKIFPKARIVGWKYELEGTRTDVLAKAARQINECKSDACVVNGAAWGEGFGFYTPDNALVMIPDKASLCTMLAKWIGKPGGAVPPNPTAS